MKKSKKLMLGTIAAMGALAIGAGAVSTFAWYSASGEASMGTHVAANSGTISTQASNANVGAFVITASVSPSTNFTLDMTDNSGNCYVWNNGAKTPATAKGDTIKTLAVSVVVTYNGSETLTSSQTLALWQGALGTKDVIITATTAQSRFKFGANSTDYTHDADNMVIGVDNDDAKLWAFNQSSNKATASQAIGNFYLSVDGTQETDDEDHADTALSGTVTFTPSVGTLS